MRGEPGDADLVRRCLQDERGAWERLVRRYGRLVYGLAKRAGLSTEDCADVFQTVFLTAYRNLHLLDRPESLSFWLTTITRREAWEAKRKLARHGRHVSELKGDGEETEPASPEPLADDELERTQRAFQVHRALDRLDERCRRLVELLFFSDPAPSYEKAARELGMPLGSLGPTRGRCLEKLRTALERLKS